MTARIMPRAGECDSMACKESQGQGPCRNGDQQMHDTHALTEKEPLDIQPYPGAECDENGGRREKPRGTIPEKETQRGSERNAEDRESYRPGKEVGQLDQTWVDNDRRQGHEHRRA
ncbi:MAG: hypothetical protein LC732_12400, partial [Acidobacteria bacterium]|nr:hypothetical protein [Acidobacteriota bacterium]